MKIDELVQIYVKSKKYRQEMHLPEEVVEEYQLLAQGEYNRNYLFIHPDHLKKYILRINIGSQMHLENQIEYEYKALENLEDTGRTPKVFYVDGTREIIPYGVLVMEFLPGHALDYRNDLIYAAECLANIHSLKNEKWSEILLSPKNPLRAILEECEEMFKVYDGSQLGDIKIKDRIRRMLNKGWEKVECLSESPYKCCINTELNSTNFLINGKNKDNYLIDWEKPLYGDPAQDLGHFLAPTTTFWKTDVILTSEQICAFLNEYIEKVDGRYDTTGLEERVGIFIPITCLRGITWCSMAWVQYQNPDKLIFNESTFRKLEAYMSEEFLLNIENTYI